MNWVTLSLWGFVTPFHYPCKTPLNEGDETEARARAISTLQRATKALGGNVVVVSVLWQFGAHGWALRVGPSKPAEKAADGPSVHL